MQHLQRTPETDELWRGLLTATHPLLRRHRRVLNLLPGTPRCKLCSVPFGGFCGQLFRFSGKRPSNLNPAYCSLCDDLAREHPGGVELELTFVFADVRGSTSLAESMSPAAFRDLMNRFYDTAIRLFTRSDAFIDKVVGDEVVALYLPAFAGDDFTERAIADCRELLAATGHGAPGEPWLSVGIGIHTGEAFVGSVGPTGGHTDFTALGDAVNVAARLTSMAKPGEILASEAACRAAGLDPPSDATWRTLELSGRKTPIRAVSLGAPGTAMN
jgi:adenylate cyclase